LGQKRDIKELRFWNLIHHYLDLNGLQIVVTGLSILLQRAKLFIDLVALVT
jgi:hypothetical protein